MSYLPDQRPERLRPLLSLLALCAVVLGLSVIVFTHPYPSVSLWLVGIMMILLHTILFYRLGRLSERVSAKSSQDFFRGLKQGLTGRRD